MATTTKQETHPLVAKQQELIAAYDKDTALVTKLAAKVEAGDEDAIKASRSANARKANRSKEIGQVELDMRLANADGGEQIEFTAWVKPQTSSNGKSRPKVSQEQMVTDLQKVGAIYNASDTPDEVKHDCDVRIVGLLKSAERYGYTVKDPRKKS